jgi:HK97 family phage prohead protease
VAVITTIQKRASLGDPLVAVDENRLEGYFMLFEKMSRPSKPAGRWVEIIHRGAWRNVNDSIRANMNHRPELLLGKTPTTLRLRMDDHGIFGSIDLPETSYAADLKSIARRGELEASVEFNNYVPEIEKPASGPIVQHVRKLDLVAVSAMTYGAAYDTSLSIRDELFDSLIDEPHMTLEYAEALLRTHSRL